MKTLGKRLYQARSAAGLSLRALAERVGLSHMAIKKYEDGNFYPSSDILLKLSQALGVRVEYFLRPTTAELSEIKFRKREGLSKKAEKAIQSEIRDQMERRLELENLYPSPTISSFSLPKSLSKKIRNLNEVESVANKMREAWQLGKAPIADLIDLLEKLGIRIFIVHYEEYNFDGLSTFINDEPVIVISSHWPGDRQRFTLAHELGHLIFQGKLSGLDEEQVCNRFAGAFLFPKQSVFEEIGQHRRVIEWQELALLKNEYKLSLGAICYRLRDLGIIKESYFKKLYAFLKNKGWDKEEPGQQIPSERSHIFKQMVFHALGEDYIGESKAAELLNYPLDRFRSFRLMEDDGLNNQ